MDGKEYSLPIGAHSPSWSVAQAEEETSYHGPHVDILKDCVQDRNLFHAKCRIGQGRRENDLAKRLD